MALTFSFDLIEFIREYIDNIKTGDHHAEPTNISVLNKRCGLKTYANFDGRSAIFTASLKTSRAPNGILSG